jgi:hypothetical protein
VISFYVFYQAKLADQSLLTAMAVRYGIFADIDNMVLMKLLAADGGEVEQMYNIETGRYPSINEFDE